jgi:hypothetical protein
MTSHPGEGGGTTSSGDVAERALDVLRQNSIGDATSPSRKLYPHQWSWDSACIAIGYARFDQDRAEAELRSLFRAQWRNGLLPHIVFTEGARYFPGPEFWQTERSPNAPTRPQTSGIVQPAVHGTALREVFVHARDRERAASFVRELLPNLTAWHEYLYRERTRDGGALVEVWHPWETGMDNSPMWDEPLARIELRQGDVPPYTRVDVHVTAAEERPSDADYDRYAYLVGLFRTLDYDDGRIRDATPFAVRPVLFNALLVQSNRDLAFLAREVGADPAPFEHWAERTAAQLDELWDAEVGVYRDFDVRAGQRLRTWCAAGLAPLYAGVPDEARASRMLDAASRTTIAVGRDGSAATSLPPNDPRFAPTLYWRGPVWPILNWVLYRGLERYGFAAEAEQIRATLVSLADTAGFWEHYDPLTGIGHGGEQFAWTAALVLDLVGASSTNGTGIRPN